MRFRLTGLLAAFALLAACEEAPTPTSAPAQQPQSVAKRSAAVAQREFAAVARVVEPVAERECQRRTSGVNCDFRILIDDRPGMPPNAFQTLDKNKRPIIIFTLKLLQQASNADEIAFVMSHEAAHHIKGHIARQQQNAVAGAVLLAGLATLAGADASAVQTAQKLGAQVGARTYSKDFELEADALGTVITARAGYSPLRGAAFFNRIPDPGDRFLGTHPPNADRIATVRRVASGL